MIDSRILQRRIFATLMLCAWCSGGPGLAQSFGTNVKQIEQGVLEKINDNRRIFRLPPLQPDATLSQVARAHSVDMMSQGKVTHESALPGQRTPEDRYQQAFGSAPPKLTENVAVQPADYSAPGFVFTALHAQPGTFQNLVDKEATTVGVGVAVGPDGSVWATVMYARPAGSRARGTTAEIPPPPSPAPTPAPPSEQPAHPGTSGEYTGSLAKEFFAFLDAFGGFPEMYHMTEKLPGGDAAVQELLAFVKDAFQTWPNSPDSWAQPLQYGVLGTRLKEFHFYQAEQYHTPKTEVDRNNIMDVPRNVPFSLMELNPTKKLASNWEVQGVQNMELEVTKPGGPPPGYVSVGFNFDLSCDRGAPDPGGRIAGECKFRYEHICGVDIESGNRNNPHWTSRFSGHMGPLYDKLAWYAVPEDSPNSVYRLYFDKKPETQLRSDQLMTDAMPHFPVLVAVLRPKGAPPVAEVRTLPPPPPAITPPKPPAPVAVSTSPQDDEDRAADIRWLGTIEDQLNDAERLKNQALFKLQEQALTIAEWQKRVDQLSNWLKDLPPEEEAATWLEAALRSAIDAWDSAWGPAPGPTENVRAVVRSQIEVLQQKIRLARQEQGDEIQEILETYYGGIVDQLRERGPQCRLPEARAGAAQAVKDVNQLISYSKAELYLAANWGKEFQDAARASIAEGRYVPETHFLQATWAASHGNPRLALEAFRLVEEETANPGETPLAGAQARQLGVHSNSLHDRARAMVWILEDAYLKGIAAKAAGEAQQVRAEIEERLQKAGDDSSIVGNALTYLKMGEVSSLSAITGREDALEGLASAYQNNVAAQEYGLLLMQSLHERGVSLDSLRGMSNQEFLDLIHGQYREAGQRVTVAEAVHMRAAILAALSNPDVSRMVSGSKQMLRVDTGADYFDHDPYAQTGLEWWGDVINLSNVVTFLAPVTDFSIVGKVLGRMGRAVLGDARAAGAAIDSVTETAVVWEGASKLPALFAETKTGQMMLNEFSRFFADSTWLKDRALEMSLALIGGKAAEGVGGTIGVLMGSDGKAEAEAGALLGSMFMGMAAGNAEEMKGLMTTHGITSEQVQRLVAAEERAAKESAELAEAASRHSTAIREVLPVSPGEPISAQAKLLAGTTKQGIERELDEAIRDIELANRMLRDKKAVAIDAAMFRKLDELKIAYEGAAAAEGGEVASARAFLDMLDRRARNFAAKTVVPGGASEAAEVAAALPPAGPRPGAMGGSSPAGTSRLAGVASFRGNPATVDLDRLVMDVDKFPQALADYERRLAVLRQLGAGEIVEAAHLPENVASLQKTAELKSIVGGWEKRAAALEHERPVTPQEVAHLEVASRPADGRLKLQLIAGSEFKNEYEQELVSKLTSHPERGAASSTPKAPSYHKPYWVLEDRGGEWVRVGVFKPGRVEFKGLDVQAETLFEDVKRAIGPVKTAAGREIRLGVAACAPAKMYVGETLTNGAFIRFTEGAEVGALGMAGGPLVKEQIAGDKVISAVFADPDRHADNYLIAGLGDVTDFDHALADFDGHFFEQEYGSPSDRELLKNYMKRPILAWRQRSPVVRALDEHITIEDMQPWIDALRPFLKDENSVREFLKTRTRIPEGEVFERVVKLAPKRYAVLEETLRECFGSKKDLKPLPMTLEETKTPSGVSGGADGLKPIPMARAMPRRALAPQTGARFRVEGLAMAA